MRTKQPPRYDPETAAPLVIPDQVLIQCLADHGMPKKDAIALTVNTGLRLMATRFYFDVGDAGRGNRAARERVDYCREIWTMQARRERERAA